MIYGRAVVGRSSIVFALLVVPSGCGEDDVPEALDAGADAGIDASPDAAVEDLEPAPPELPASPSLPILTPCPEGWLEVGDPDDAALRHCRPWPEDGPDDCRRDEAHFPGGPGCERVGTECPAGDWADDLPADRPIVFVRPGALDGTGTREAPFGTLAEALAAAAGDTIVALAKGRLDEAATVSSAVTLWGACADETIVASSAPSDTEPTLRFTGGAAAARNLTVSGARMGIEITGADAEVDLESIVVRDVEGTGVAVTESATLRARELAIRDGEAVLESDAGLHVSGEATVDLERAILERNGSVGIVVDGATLVAGDLAVVESLPLKDPMYTYFGEGLRAWGGARVELRRATFVRNSRFAVRVVGEGTSLDAEDVLVEQTESGPTDASLFGTYGLEARAGASVRLSRVSFHEEPSPIFLHQAEAELEDVIIADTLTGGCLSANEVANGSLRRVAIVRGPRAALTTSDGELDVSDLTVRDMYAPADVFADGIGVTVLGGRLLLERVRMEGIAGTGLAALGDGTDVTARDITIEIPHRDDPGRGFGAEVIEGAHVALERALFDGGGAFTIWARSPGSELDATDLTIRDTRGIDAEYTGVALMVLSGALGRFSRVHLSDNRDTAILCHDGGHMTLEDLVVERTLRASCPGDACDELGGFGVSAVDDGTMEITRFRITESALCGVQVAFGGTMDLHHGEVSGGLIGANVQTEGFDVGRLQDHVLFFDNERNLDTSELQVPRVATGLF